MTTISTSDIEKFAEVVQDRASELLTGDFEDKQRCREIAEELYQLATRML